MLGGLRVKLSPDCQVRVRLNKYQWFGKRDFTVYCMSDGQVWRRELYVFITLVLHEFLELLGEECCYKTAAIKTHARNLVSSANSHSHARHRYTVFPRLIFHGKKHARNCLHPYLVSDLSKTMTRSGMVHC